MNEENRRQLEKIFIKDIGWKTVGYDHVLEISEHEANNWVKIVFSGAERNWVVNPFYVIIKSYL